MGFFGCHIFRHTHYCWWIIWISYFPVKSPLVYRNSHDIFRFQTTYIKGDVIMNTMLLPIIHEYSCGWLFIPLQSITNWINSCNIHLSPYIPWFSWFTYRKMRSLGKPPKFMVHPIIYTPSYTPFQHGMTTTYYWYSHDNYPHKLSIFTIHLAMT